MDKFPLLLEGRPRGELTVEQESLYTLLTARCPLPDGLWCAWVIGEQGNLRLGVLEPLDGCGVIRRRFSRRQTAPLGRILRGEARPNGIPPASERPPEPEIWNPAPSPERLFRTPWLRQRLQGRQGVLASTGSASPSDQGQPSVSGQVSKQGQPSVSGQVSKQGQPSVSGQVSKQGQPSVLGQVSKQGQTFVSGQVSKQGQPSVSGQPSRQNQPSGSSGQTRSGFRIALPWDPGQPFPLPPLFCFGTLKTIGQGQYLVFSFDGRERPVF